MVRLTKINPTVIMVVVLTVVSIFIIFSVGYHLDIIANDYDTRPLERSSCEQTLHNKIRFSEDFMFLFPDYYNNVLKVAEKKWVLLDCSNPNSENWKGDDWLYNGTEKPVLTIQDKIVQFEDFK